MASQKEIWNKEYLLNKDKWKKETKNLPKIFFGSRVLEIGVGNGKTLSSIVRQKPKTVYAIDNSLQAIMQSKEKFFGNDIILKEMDVKNMSFDEGFFDVVVCNYTLNNLLLNERKIAINEIERVLKQFGILIFEDFFTGDFRESLSELYKEKNTRIKRNGIICHFFTKEEVLDLFKGFKIKKVQVRITSPIKSKKNIKRKIINGIFVKL